MHGFGSPIAERAESPAMTEDAAAAGPIGGAANEDGSRFRAGVGAFVIACGLARVDVGLDLADGATPVWIAAESDNATDDLAVGLEVPGDEDDAIALVQAKIEIPFGGSQTGAFATDVVAQWVRSVELDEVTADRDRLVLAVERPTKQLRDLGSALTRLRLLALDQAQNLSKREADALQTFRQAGGFADPEVLDAVARLAVILPIGVTEVGRESALAAAQMLEGSVVDWRQGDAAYQLLRDEVRDLAANRRRATMDVFRERLSSAPFLAPSGPPPDPNESIMRRYLDRVAALGATVDLRPLGASIPPLRVESPTSGLRVSTVDGGSRHLSLPLALRRRGRVLLVGAGGSGKSVALRQVAARAALAEGWPVPIFVPLKALRAVSPDENPVEVIASVAASLVREPDRPQTARLLRDALDRGTALLLLDGLDECRDRAGHVVSSLSQLFGSVHPDTEVLLSTRPVREALGATLGLVPLALEPPEDLDETLSEVARSLALARDLPESEREAYSTDLISTAMEVLGSQQAFLGEPLLAVLALLLIDGVDPAVRPTNVSGLLAHLIDDVIVRWELNERRANRIEIGGIDEGSRSAALRASFGAIANELVDVDELELGSVVEVVARLLNESFGAPTGSAVGGAEDVLEFWDEAGVFKMDGGLISVPVRTICDIGAAQHAATRSSDEKGRWLNERLTTGNEAAAAAGALIDPEMAELLAGLANSSDDPQLLIMAATAAADGGLFSTEAYDALRDRLVVGVSTLEPEDAWRAVGALARFDAGKAEGEAFLTSIETSNLPADRRIVAVVAVLGAWNALDLVDPATLERAIETHGLSSLNGEVGRLEIAVDSLQVMAAGAAADFLLERDGSMAVVALIQQAAVESSFAGLRRLNSVLVDHDRPPAVLKDNPLQSEQIRATIERSNRAWEAYLNILGGVGGRRDLTLRERRSGSGPAAMTHTLAIPKMAAGALDGVIEKASELLVTAIGLIGELGGLSLDLVCSQTLALDDDPDFGPHDRAMFLMDYDTALDFDWARVPDDRVVALIESSASLLSGPLMLARIGVDALEACPAREEVVVSVEPYVTDQRPWLRGAAASVLLHHAEDARTRAEEWLVDGDPQLRSAAAEHLLSSDEATEAHVRSALADPDCGVRAAGLNSLQTGTRQAEFAAVVGECRDRPPKSWQCSRCATDNPAETRACSRCHLMNPIVGL
jgi:hypothetical protein